MKVLIPGALRSYTGESHVEAEGDTLNALFADLDRRYPGLRFRVVDEQGLLRPNMRIFVNGLGARSSACPEAGRLRGCCARAQWGITSGMPLGVTSHCNCVARMESGANRHNIPRISSGLPNSLRADGRLSL